MCLFEVLGWLCWDLLLFVVLSWLWACGDVLVGCADFFIVVTGKGKKIKMLFLSVNLFLDV